MVSSSDFPARGKVIRVEDGAVIFAPSNTTYELKLVTAMPYTGAVGALVDGFVKLRARKLWTVASGGNFVTPIQGPPRIVQGRIKFLDQQSMVVQAGLPVMVQLPPSDSQYDLNNGPLTVGTLVNCTVLPGAAFELLDVTGATTPAAPTPARAAISPVNTY